MLSNEAMFDTSKVKAWISLHIKSPADVRRFKAEMEGVGLHLQVLVNFCAAGGQRTPELEDITLVETDLNPQKALRADEGIGLYLVGDSCKQEGLDPKARKILEWCLPDPYAAELVRYVVACTQLLFNLHRMSGADEATSYMSTRFLSNLGPRKLLDKVNEMHVRNGLPKQKLARQLREWISKSVGSDMDDAMVAPGPHETAAIESSGHSVRTGLGWYANDPQKRRQTMRALADK